MRGGHRVNNLKVEEKLVHTAKGGTRSDDYRQINPLGKLPCLQVLSTHLRKPQTAPRPYLLLHTDVYMQEQDFTLPESASILRYIATTKGVPDHWYPSKACRLS